MLANRRLPAAAMVALLALVSGCASVDESLGSEGEMGVEANVRSEEAAGQTDDRATSAADASSVDVMPAESRAEAEGFVSCDTLPTLAPTVQGDIPPGRNPDDAVVSSLQAYGQANAEHFAGLWLDRDHGGTVVLAFTDDPAAHLEALAAQGISTEHAFDVVQAEFTENELRSAQESAFDGTIGSLVSGGVSVTQNRVSFDLIDPTEDDISNLAEVVPVGMVCLSLTFTKPIPTGPLQILPTDGPDQLLTCDTGPSFPRSALTERTPLESSDHPAAQAMLEFIADLPADPGPDSDLLPGGPGWYVLFIGQNEAMFTRFDGDQPTVNTRVGKSETAWTVSGWGFGCNLEVATPEGLGRVRIHLDPDAGLPQPEDTMINLLVVEQACNSGREMGERLLGPQIIEQDDAVTLAFAAAPNPRGGTCQGNPFTPVTVELSEPLGDRVLIDGMEEPPRTIESP